jgi:hypothetical protein
MPHYKFIPPSEPQISCIKGTAGPRNRHWKTDRISNETEINVAPENGKQLSIKMTCLYFIALEFYAIRVSFLNCDDNLPQKYAAAKDTILFQEVFQLITKSQCKKIPGNRGLFEVGLD